MKYDDFKCGAGRLEGKIEYILEGPGSYHLAWCPIKENYISNCDNCEYNEIEKEIRADPNNYQEWLRKGGKHKYV